MSDPARARFARLFPWLLAIGLPLLAGVLLRGDSNWDLRNYHLYNAHAWLTGRAALDIAPAQLQSWHNPLLDVPLVLLVHAGAPARATTLWLVLPAIASLWALLRLQARLSLAPPTLVAQAVLALLAMTGAAMGSTLGLAMDDGFVAAGMLCAIAVALGHAGEPAGGAADATARRLVLAGLIAGATAGLKLSGAFYCIALAAALVPGGSLAERARRLVALAAGGVVGAALTYGAWGWHLQTQFGNPFFPYYNDVFASPAAALAPWMDRRFLPATAGDMLLAPFRLLADSQRYAELRMRDPRLLLGLLGFAWLAWRARVDADAQRSRALRGLVLFVLVGSLAWVAQTGIYRYAIVLEALGVLALVLVLQDLRRHATTALLVALVLVSADTRQPHWGRDAGPQPLARMRAPALGANALVLTATGDPLAYLALGLPADVPMVGVSNNFMQPNRCDGLQRLASARIAAHGGPLWLLEAPTGPVDAAREVLRAHYRLVVGTACVAYENPLAPARLCPLQRAARAGAGATVPLGGIGPVRDACQSQAR